MTTPDARMCLRWRRRLAAPEDKAGRQEVLASEEEASRPEVFTSEDGAGHPEVLAPGDETGWPKVLTLEEKAFASDVLADESDRPEVFRQTKR